ncbi:MAG: M1 family metallopeptidase, partial [Solirubrobacterales bacterium]|nr:M1 family metallopeptidase [Solirubrobacterales bacterium]
GRLIAELPLLRVPARGTESFDAEARVPRGIVKDAAATKFFTVACVQRRGFSGAQRCERADGRTTVLPTFAGGRSLGDPLFPQVGNRGYEVSHYDLAIDYDPGDGTPGDHAFLPGTSTTIDARASRNLSQFSLDFQRFDVSRVTVDGDPARFRYAGTEPLGDPAVVTQLKKLVVTPAEPVRRGAQMQVKVDYTGTPREMTDADESIEGWIQACYTPTGGSRTCDGSFTVNEPNGAQTIFPSNNYPAEKATFDTAITVPSDKTAFGAGELVGGAPVANGDGTSTWSWTEDDPIPTYLTSATVGDFTYEESAFVEAETGEELDVYTGVDSTATPDRLLLIQSRFAEIPTVTNYLTTNLFGAYPFDSTGGVADRTDNVFYALENATKPHYAGGNSNPSVGSSTQVHELAHQWMGDSVSPRDWLVIGFNEGWATFAELEYAFDNSGGPDPATFADDYYEDPETDWSLAPADLDGDPANLFAAPTYDRTAAMLQYLREILGDEEFFAFAERIAQEYAYSTISWQQFIDEAVGASGFGAEQSAQLEEFFEQWLYGEVQPTLTPEDFAG